MILTGTSLQTYLRNLGSFWQQHFADANVFDAALTISEDLLQEAYYRLMETYLARDRQQMRLTHRKLWTPVDFNLYNVSSHYTANQAEPAYRIHVGPDVKEIPYLYDRIGHPRIVLRQGKNYEVDNGDVIFNPDAMRVLLADPRIARRVVETDLPELMDLPGPVRTATRPPLSAKKPWQTHYPYDIANPASAANDLFALTTFKGTVFDVRLWAPRMEMDEQLLQRFWADLVDLEISSTEEERLYTDAVLLLYFQGPSAQSFTTCANIAAGLPLVEEDCVLTSVVDDGTNYTVNVKAWRATGWEDQAYTFSKRYLIRTDIDDPSQYNTLILRAGDVLTRFFRAPITDQETPDWWKGLEIPEDLFDATAARRDTGPTRKRFTFNTGDPDYYGDPGLYFGGDENGDINQAVEIKDAAADAQTYPVGAPFLDVEDYYMVGAAGERTLLPQVGPVAPAGAYARVVGPHTVILEADQAGGLAPEAMPGRTVRLTHPNRILNMALGDETRPSGVDGEILGIAPKPFRFQDLTAANFTKDLAGGILRITGRVVESVTVPTLLGIEGDYFIVRDKDTDEIDVVKSNIHNVPAGGPFDEFPFPLGRAHGVTPTAVILGNLADTDAQVGGEDEAGDVALAAGGGVVNGTTDKFTAAGYSFEDYEEGYYLEVYVPAATPFWCRARFTLATVTELDLTWLDGTGGAPADPGDPGNGLWSNLSWRLKRMGNTVRVQDGLFTVRNVSDAIVLSADALNLGNDFTSDIYAVNFVVDGGNDYNYLIVDRVIVPPLAGGWQTGRTYAHTLRAALWPLLIIDETETFAFGEEHVEMSVDIVVPVLGLSEIKSVISSKVVEIDVTPRDTELLAQWEIVLTESALVWEFIPRLDNAQQERVIFESQEHGGTGRILLTLLGEPLAYPFPDALDMDDVADAVLPTALGTWEKRAQGGFELTFLEAASLRDDSFSVSAAIVSYFGHFPTGATVYVGIINQGEFTGVYELLGIHSLATGLWVILTPAADTFSSAQALGTWPPADWANVQNKGTAVPARWEGVVNLGRAAGTHPPIAFTLFEKYLRHHVWGYDLRPTSLNMGDDRYLFKILDKIIKARPSHTYAMLYTPGEIETFLDNGFDPEVDLPGSPS